MSYRGYSSISDKILPNYCVYFGLWCIFKDGTRDQSHSTVRDVFFGKESLSTFKYIWKVKQYPVHLITSGKFEDTREELTLSSPDIHDTFTLVPGVHSEHAWLSNV